MKQIAKKISICAAVSLVGFVQGASSMDWKIPKSIEIFTRADVPVRGIELVRQRLQDKQVSVVYYDLDAPRAFEDQLGADLPKEGKISPEMQQAIKRQLAQKLQAIGQEQLQALLHKHYQGSFIARRYQIDRYPAVVFDGKSVVYGVEDLTQAWGYYHRWKQ